MKLALLMSNGETVALASRLIATGASVCTAQTDAPRPSSDWLIFDESIPLASPDERTATRKLIGNALVSGMPVFAFLSPAAPATPRCALVMSEMLSPIALTARIVWRRTRDSNPERFLGLRQFSRLLSYQLD